MSIEQMDYQLFHAINEWARTAPMLNPLIRFLAKDAFYLFFIGLLAYWFMRKGNHRKMVIEAAVSLCIGLAFSWILGHLFYRDRPFVAHAVLQLIDHPVNASFPSDHALGAFVIATSIGIYRRKEGILWWILAALIAISRVWAGVHYPTDIIGGAIIGILVAFGVHSAVSRSRLLSRCMLGCIRIYETCEAKIWPGSKRNEQKSAAQGK